MLVSVSHSAHVPLLYLHFLEAFLGFFGHLILQGIVFSLSGQFSPTLVPSLVPRPQVTFVFVFRKLHEPYVHSEQSSTTATSVGVAALPLLLLSLLAATSNISVQMTNTTTTSIDFNIINKN
jgi:hypothetical protein